VANVKLAVDHRNATFRALHPDGNVVQSKVRVVEQALDSVDFFG
jgi:hypothetical protein